MTSLAPGQRFFGGEVPEIQWTIQDDKCDCVFQRIGDWTNPYIGRTLRVRICCMWSDLYKEYPQHVQEIPGYYNANTELFEGPQEWNGEEDMPRVFWYRQLATMTGLSLPEVRKKFQDQEPPKGVPRPKLPPQQRAVLSEHEIIGRQLVQIEQLGTQLDATIATIHELKNGTISLDQIELTDGGFQVADLEKEPVA